MMSFPNGSRDLTGLVYHSLLTMMATPTLVPKQLQNDPGNYQTGRAHSLSFFKFPLHQSCSPRMHSGRPSQPSVQTDAISGKSSASRLMRSDVAPSNFASDDWKRWLADVVHGAPPVPAPRLLPIAFAAVSARS
jgi:hypothetical protein